MPFSAFSANLSKLIARMVQIIVNKQRVTLNCDMGESFGNWKMGSDELVMPWVDMANIACGFHASDPSVMSKTVALAKHYKVKIGAHPGYQDLVGFGRRSIPHTPAQISEIVLYQVGALKAVCQYHDVPLHYVKPHGALYNDMMESEATFRAICEAVSIFGIPLMILATSNNQRYLDIADIYDVPLLFEAFADRQYQEDGKLTPRSQANAVYHQPEDIYNQALQIATYGSVNTANGTRLSLEADTICVHGDNPESIALVQRISQAIAKM
ncbi:LamB/YcsF family protein [Vibrio vulnificus]|nr:LamB/YcsF family protein [Vibrio vulnificus]RZQ48548.1 LamB/YcsF family protein [Vibrio vulnificus]HAS8279454.1 LamB/YcsF family protein [Vibrio vulnificus]